jgi:peptidoglycan/LPS O-acetylase OafA/YrhL
VLIPLNLDVPNRFELGVNAGYAVMYFYVISGFLMDFVLKNKYAATSSGTLQFYQSRFIRIFSVYWPMMIVALLFMPGAANTFQQSTLVNKFSDIFLLGLDWLWSFGGSPVPGIGQSWTLGAELTFYAMAPFILRRRKLVWYIFLASAAIRLYLVHLFGWDAFWTYQFFPSTVLFFLLGAIANRLSSNFPIMKSQPIGILFICAVPFFLMVPQYAEWDTTRFWLSFLCFALALPSVFTMTKDNRALNVIGDLSYPLYLIHGLIIAAVLWMGWPDDVLYYIKRGYAGWVILFTIIGVTLIASLLVHLGVEKTVAHLMRSTIESYRTKPAPA